MLALLSILVGALPARALPPEPIDDDPIGDDPYEPPANGFNWSVPSRFGTDSNHDGLIDFHWIQNGTYDPNGYYDPAYVHPSQYPVTFDGCQTESESQGGTSTNTYRWRFLSPGELETAPGLVVQGNNCRIVHAFPTQDTYRAQLTITQPDGTVVLVNQQDIVIKDFLIVSIGDSFASGEGNPDIPASLTWIPVPFPGFWTVDRQPRWQDARCGRSKWAGPAQAAMAIERYDPHTSVTFLSFACSGATIDTPGWEGNDINKPVGTGILGPYRGSEMPPGSSYNPSTFIPSQIDQVRAAVQGRPIDALIISGGGNDIRFGTVAKECVTTANCWINAYAPEYPGSGSYRLDTLVNRAMSALPGKFAQLDAEIDTLNVANVYITQYPDLTRSDNINAPDDGPFEAGRYCSLVGDIVWGLEMSPPESKYASWFALDRLNDEVGAAAAMHGWVFVDGIAEPFRTWDGKGHGYCASDAWIRTASDAWFMQGPLWYSWYPAPIVLQKQDTKGTLHPTARGHQVYAQRLQEEIWPRLNPNATNTPPPVFSSSLTIGASTSRQGQNGWLTGRCVGATCTSDQAVLKVEATVQAPGVVLRGTKVTINGVDGCGGVPGISCTTTTSAGSLTHTWAFNISQTGIYQLQFQARDSNLQISTFAYEVKVDLSDPTASALIAEETPAQAGWYTAPVAITLAGDDPNGLSGVTSIRYTLDGTADENVPGSTLAVDSDGAHSLLYRAVDLAGRQGPQQALSFQIDQTAPATSAAAEGQYQSGSWTQNNIDLTLTAADNQGGSGVAALTYSASGAQYIGPTPVPGQAADLSITAEGETTLTYYAEDEAGNIEAAQSFTVRIDRTAPMVSCGTADGAWHDSDVNITCSASDSGSGFADGASTTFSLTTNVPAGTEMANAATGSQQVCDLAGNCATAGPVSGNKVDKKGPVITIASPTATSYLLNEVAASSYTCDDQGSGLATCSGPVTNGSQFDTASPGAKGFQVSASDQVGNSATQAVSYNVSYNLCLLYDPSKSHKAGSTVPIRLQICDAGGVNYSTGNITLSAGNLVKIDNSASGDVAPSSTSNPDHNFRYDEVLQGYIFNLSTKNLSSGTWALKFMVSTDPVMHTIYFDVR